MRVGAATSGLRERLGEAVTSARTGAGAEASCRNVLVILIYTGGRRKNDGYYLAFHRRTVVFVVFCLRGTGAVFVVGAWTAPIGVLLRRELHKIRKRRTCSRRDLSVRGVQHFSCRSTASYSRRTAPGHRLGRTVVAENRCGVHDTRTWKPEASCKHTTVEKHPRANVV